MPVVDGLPMSVNRWHVPPRQAALGPPEHTVDHHSVIGPPATPARALVGQQRLQPGPLRVGQIMTIEHQLGLPHLAFKIRGTRSSRHPWPAHAEPTDKPGARSARPHRQTGRDALPPRERQSGMESSGYRTPTGRTVRFQVALITPANEAYQASTAVTRPR